MSEPDVTAGGAMPPHDLQLLGQLIGEEGGGFDVFPLAFAQERLWFLDQLEPGSPLYNIATALHLQGALRPEVLKQALDELVRRHESLRTVFPAVGGRPVQLVLPPQEVPLPVVRLAAAAESLAEPLVEAVRLAGEEARRPFDLQRGPLLRALLLELSAGEWVVALTLHHIVSDGWSNGVLVTEMTALYEAFAAGLPSPLPELPIQYPDFAVWQRQTAEEALGPQLDYWRRQLAGLPVLALQVDRPRQPRRSRRGAQLALDLPAPLVAGLAALARRAEATLFTALLGVFDVLLHRYSRQVDIPVGSLIANRGRTELEGLVGCFADALVLRADLGGDPSFLRLVERLKPMVLDAYGNAEVPFAKLVEQLDPERRLGQTPLFQVMLLLQSAPQAEPALRGMIVRLLPVEAGVAKLDLLLSLTPRGDGLAGTLEYDADLFERATVERLAAHLLTLAEEVARDPARSLARLPLMAAAEEAAVLAQSRGERQPWRPRCIHELFEEHAARAPQAPAVACEGQVLSYGEMDARASRLACRLRSLGVGPEVRAAIRLERSPELVMAILAVLKAGGAYVPVEPRLPPAPLAALLGDAEARVLITEQRLGELPGLAVRMVLLDGDGADLASGEGAAAPGAAAAPENLAYVIYTSGSTGRPKGVALEHRQLHHYVEAVLRRLDLPPGSSFATASTVAADLGNTCIFGALASGGCLHVLAEDRLADADALAELCARHPVDVLKLVPSHLAALLAARRPERVLPRRCLILGGEAAPWALVERVRSLAPGCAVFNHYGPTEAAVGVAAGRLETLAEPASLTPPLGRPLDRTALYLLEGELRPAPAGVPAPLYAGGPGVARGYLGRPELTAERFLPDPFGEPGARLYSTGDLARYLPSGSLEFLGRIDDQVKIRGFRVEPGEIEAVLATHPAVGGASVASASGPQGTFLIAYFAAAPGAVAPAPGELRAFLAERLPRALVPQAFAPLAALPLTANGKVDRRALALLQPAPDLRGAAPAAPGGRSAAPGSPIEELLGALWLELLGVAPGSVHDSFFDLGGHSLLATQLASRIRQVFQVEMPLRRLFETPTIAGLSRWLDGAAQGSSGPALEPMPRDGRPLPLSPAQERLWFLHQLDPESPAYNLPYFVRLAGRLCVPALEAALQAVVRRHEVLRTAFVAEGGRPVQRLEPRVSLRLPIVDLARLPAGAAEEAERLALCDARRPFDLGRAPLLRATLLRVTADEHLLLLSLDHLVSDAWSRQILGREVAAFYAAALAGEPCSLSPLPLQYADFAHWQRRWPLAEELAYWRQRLAGCEPLDLPADHPRPAVRSQAGGAIALSLSPPLVAALEAVGRRQGATLFMVLLAVYQLLLRRYTGRTDLCVGTPVAGREGAETEGLIGFFVNTLVLRADLAGDPSGEVLLRRVRESALQAYAHRRLPFERLVEELQPERDLSRTPVVQVMLMLHNVPAGELALPGLAATPLAVDNRTSKLDLTLALEPAGGGLAGALEYSTDLFGAATIARLGRQLLHLAAELAADPGRPLSALSPLGAAERQQLLRDWNDTEVAVADGAGIDHLFTRQAAATPDATALRWGREGSLRYRELDGQADRLASYLRRMGVGPESRVGIQLERSADLVVAMLAVLKAGAAYLPLDPTYPRERLALMLGDAKVGLVLVQKRPAEASPASLVVLDEIAGRLNGEPLEPPSAAAGADRLAYVIYTSGSTGRPKGVMISHRNVLNFFAGMDRRLGGGAPGVWLAVTSVSFDISVLEILWALCRGFEVVIQEESPRIEAARTPSGPLPAAAARPIEFSLFYFATDEQEDQGYRLLLEGARFADRHGFTAVWTPERHFHAFGGLFPNPSVVGAALAVLTERVQIRAGSVVLPLQNPLRVAEEWAVVDRLSGGRVGLSFASGWHADDFVLAPESFHERKAIMARGIETVRRLWRGEAIELPGGTGRPVDVRIHPRPVQAELPVWVTAAGSPETFRQAGEMGAGLLTHLLGQELGELAQKIAVYREARRRSGAAGEGHVTLMLHTFLGRDLEAVRATVRRPFCNYLRSSLALWRGLAASLGHDLEKEVLAPEEEEALLDRAFDRYFESSGLLGTPQTVLAQIDRLRAAGVDEVGCLIDFGVPTDAALASLEVLAGVVEESRRQPLAATADGETSIAARIRRHGVTHLQCTPSMARMLALDPDTVDALARLKVLLVGGEALSGALARQLRSVVAGEIHNMYGPTETTVWSTTERLDDGGEPVAIGRPIANTAIYLLDADLQPVPPGVPGSLHIGGDGVGRGYLGQPDQTAERFLPDPFAGRGGGRLYATGDLARHRPDGALEFLGRVDHQVKIRGYRIETGEVEALLRRHPRVAEAVVVAREDRAADRRLVAYVVPALERPPLRPALAPGEFARRLDGHRRYSFPDGMEVAVLSEFQASLAHHEIFRSRAYLRHGIALRDGDCVLDVGANVGFFTLFASRECQHLEIHSFEPIPPTCDVLRTNVALYGLAAKVYDFGLSSRAEDDVEFTFYPQMSGLSGRYSEAARDMRATREIMLGGMREAAGEAAGRSLDGRELDDLLAAQFQSERHRCRLRTLSQVVREQGIERIDLLKVDVERAEVDVLLGIEEEHWPRIRQVVMEVDGRDNLERVAAILTGHGFAVAHDPIFARAADAGGEEILVAHLYASRDGLAADEPAGTELRDFLAARLPDYMVPSAIVTLERLPLTPNGKVDRRALPAPEARRPRLEVVYEAPATDVQRAIAGVWRDTLQVADVGLHDNFFELGGSSLTLVEVRARLRDELGHELSLVDMFRAPTIAALAQLAGRGTAAAGPPAPAFDGARERARRRKRTLRRADEAAKEIP